MFHNHERDYLHALRQQMSNQSLMQQMGMQQYNPALNRYESIGCREPQEVKKEVPKKNLLLLTEECEL